METICCRRCNQYLPVGDFTRARRGHNPLALSIFKTCSDCYLKDTVQRRGTTNMVQMPSEDDSKLVNNVECERSKVVDIIRECFAHGDRESAKVFFRLKILLVDDVASKEFETWNRSNSQAYFSQWVKKHIIPDLDVGSGYYWEIRGTHVSEKQNSQLRTTLWCGSRSDRVKFKKTACPLPTSSQRKNSRQSAKIDRFDCSGHVRLNLDTDLKVLMLTCQHLLQHAKPTHKRKMKHCPVNVVLNCAKEEHNVVLGCAEKEPAVLTVTPGDNQTSCDEEEPGVCPDSPGVNETSRIQLIQRICKTSAIAQMLLGKERVNSDSYKEIENAFIPFEEYIKHLRQSLN